MSNAECERATHIRANCPAGAVGFRLWDISGTPTRYPKATAHGRGYYAISPEVVEFPVGFPSGSYQLQFIDGTGQSIPQRRQILVSVGESVGNDAAGDEEGRRTARVQRSDDATSEHYQRKAQELALRRQRLAIAKVATKTGEISEYHSHWSSMFDDTLDRFRKFDEYSAHYHEAQLQRTMQLHDDLARLPPPPPPQQDWAGLLKAGIEGIRDLAVTVLTAREQAQPVERVKVTDDVAQAVLARLHEAVVSSVTATAPVAAPLAVLIPAAAAPIPVVTAAPIPVVATAPIPVVALASIPIVAVAPIPVVATASTPVAAVLPVPVVSASPIPIAAVAPIPVAAAAPIPIATATPIPDVPALRADFPLNDNDRASSQIAASPPQAPTHAAYRAAWLGMKRLIASLTDMDIIHMVVNPAMMVAVISTVAALAPQRPDIRQQAPSVQVGSD